MKSTDLTPVRDKALWQLEVAAQDVAAIVGNGQGLSLEDLTAISNTCATVQRTLMKMLDQVRGTIRSGEWAQPTSGPTMPGEC